MRHPNPHADQSTIRDRTTAREQFCSLTKRSPATSAVVHAAGKHLSLIRSIGEESVCAYTSAAMMNASASTAGSSRHDSSAHPRKTMDTNSADLV
ncbi:hypothetical protein PSCLAVI8L_130830 [Pseudoclavibacter sp. 8L]|nr:hypothetical protein PSCLAVI8L_130830 [Pseudoclavibacter sp. 8L]